MSAPRKIWIRVTDGSLMPERPSDADEHDNLYHHDDAVRELVALLREADSRIAWESLGMGNDFADRVEAALAKVAQEE